jgi:hypothetical protein
MSLPKQKNIISQIKSNLPLSKYKTLTQNDQKTNIKTTTLTQVNTNSFRKTGTLKFTTSKNSRKFFFKSAEKNQLGDRNYSEGKKDVYEDIKRKSESKIKTGIKADMTRDIPKTNTKSIQISKYIVFIKYK